jgi:molybdopterin converting factor small subunit
MPDVSQSVRESPAVPVVTIKLPAALHVLTGGRRQVPAEGGNIREVLVGLDRAFPGVLERILDQEGSVKRYSNVYLNDDNIRDLDDLETRVENRDVIWIVPAVAGGSGMARP